MLLDAEQLECVRANGAQHLLIAAVPGSGKTRTMAAKCQDLIENDGVDPSSITVVTFTNKAAEEIKSRINVPTLVCGTFHAVALQVLQREQFDLFDDDVTLVTDTKALHTFFATYLKDHCVQLHKYATAVVKAYHLFRTSREEDADVQPIGTVPVSVLLTCFRAYQQYKQRHHMVDFDDLLHYWHSFLLACTPHTLHTRYLLVDEVQDCNNIQFDIIRAFAHHGTRVIAVGDADQSIYAFRGANVHHIQSFGDTMPGTRTLTLCRNYRSTPEICHVAQRIIDFNSQRKKKPMESMQDSGPVPVVYPFKHVADELQFVATTCQRALHEQLECAILCRTNREVDDVCKTLQLQHVHYTLLRGTNLFEKQHVKLLMSLLTFAFCKDPPDANMLELFTAHKQITKPVASQFLRTLQADVELNSLVEVFLRNPEPPPPLHTLRVALQQVHNALQQVHACADHHAYSAYATHVTAVVMMYLRDTLHYTLEQMHDVRQVDTMREGYQTFDLFLKSVQLGAAQVKASGTSLIHVGTLHQAKSLEFECVVITGCANGSIPSFLATNSMAEVEEERRLLYVGATRAKQQLCFTFAVHSSFDRKEEKPRQLSYLLAPFVDVLVTKQLTHLLPPPPPPVFASVSDAISHFYRTFGRYNLLGAMLEESVANIAYYMDFMSQPPQDLAPDLLPSPLHAALMRNLLQSFLTSPQLSLQTRVQQVAEHVFGSDRVTDSICVTLRTRKWVAVLHDMQAFAQRLLGAEPCPLMVGKKVVHQSNHYDCTVDVLISRSLFCVVYDTQPGVASLLNVYLTAAILASTVQVTTLVLCNLYTGTLHRQPFRPLPCHKLPMCMQTHPLVQLLLSTPVHT